MFVRFILACSFVCLLFPAWASGREWHSRVGNFSVEAELIDVREGNAILKRTDGRTISVPLDKLSLADVRYINEEFAKAQAAIGGNSPQPMPSDPSPPPTGSKTPASPSAAGKAPPLAQAGGGWQVVPDPPAKAWALPDDLELAVPVKQGMGSSLAMALQPSPFALLRVGGTFDKSRQLWDLRTGKMVRNISGLEGSPSALSPDGKHFVGVPMHKGKIRVWSLENGAVVQELALSHWAERVHYVDFAGPDRVIASLDRTKAFAIWDLKSGERIADFSSTSLPSGWYRYCVSPGGHYVAFPENNVVKILDTRNAVVAGQLQPPPGSREGEILQVANVNFSPDGQELAIHGSDGGGSAIIVWNLATGEIASDLRFEKPLIKSVDHAGGYGGRALQWFPDRKAWLVFGRGIVDRELGKLIWVEPTPADGHAPGDPRLLVDGQRIIKLGGTQAAPKFELVRLPAEEIAKSTALVQSGATVKDAGLPPITPADRAGAQTVTFERQPNNWHYQPDGQVSETPLLAEAIDVNIKVPDLRSLWFSAQTLGKAVVTAENHELKAKIGVPTGREFYRFDLKTRQKDAHFTVPFPTQLIDYSPDGEQLLFRIAKDDDRLDIWSISSGDHVVGFRPYQQEPPDAQKVTWAAFTDSATLLTLNGKGNLVGWKLPACQAAFQIEIPPQSTQVLSPARKYLLVYKDNELHFLETASGKCVATLPSPQLEGGFGVSALAISGDGKSLAALLTSLGMSNVVTWNLVDGSLSGSFQLHKGGSGLSWSGPSHLLVHGDALNLSVIDLVNQTYLWRYTLPFGCHSIASPDGRHWFVGGETPHDFGKIAAFALPSAETTKFIEDFADVKPVIGQGTPVALDIDFDPPPQAEKLAAFIAAARESLTEALAKAGLSVVDEATVRLRVRLDETRTDDALHLRSFGLGGSFSVPISNWSAKLEFVDGAGEVFWTKSGSFKTSAGFIEHIPNGADPKMYFRMKPWHAAMAWFKGAVIPKRIYHKDIADGFGQSKLTPDGPVVEKTINELPKKPQPAQPRGKITGSPRESPKMQT